MAPFAKIKYFTISFCDFLIFEVDGVVEGAFQSDSQSILYIEHCINSIHGIDCIKGVIIKVANFERLNIGPVQIMFTSDH